MVSVLEDTKAELSLHAISHVEEDSKLACHEQDKLESAVPKPSPRPLVHSLQHAQDMKLAIVAALNW